MSAVVREIDGIKGFCMYKNGQPYTYIYTRDAIEMLGLIKLQDGYKRLRINTFGEHYLNILDSVQKLEINSSDIGVTLTPKFAISQVTSPCPTRWTSNRIKPFWKPSKYDSILPEFILDRVIFAIANRLHNKTAEEFRLQLFCTIIPHFQQTATQDQISKVPILNQTTKFMYDNTDYQVVTQQAYNFARQILDMHLNRLAILRKDTMDHVFAVTTKEYNDILESNEENNLIYYLDIFLKCVRRITGVQYARDLNTLKDTIIFNQRIYSEYITYLIHLIREEEEYLIMEANGETLVRKEVHEPSGNIEEYDEVEYKDTSRISPVKFLNMREMTGLY